MLPKRLALIVSILCLSGCLDSSHHGVLVSKAAKDTKQSAPTGVLSENAPSSVNPIAVPYTSFSAPRKDRAISACLSINVNFNNSAKGYSFEGSLVAKNSCGISMAILVNPVETYYRITSSDFFVSTTLVEPAYAILYIFRPDLGIENDAFMGDGGLEVFAWPEFAVVPAGSKIELPLTGAERMVRNLPPGRYSAILTTIAAPTTLQRGGASAVDLGKNVASINSKGRLGRVDVRPDAKVVVTPISSFTISRPRKVAGVSR